MKAICGTIGLVTLFAGWVCSFALQAQSAAPALQTGKHALLVGCTKYDHLPQRKQLEGPANDVVLLRQILRDRFGFADGDIVTLAEGEGPNHRPTRANVKREFDRLARLAKTGDQVFIHLSGHGSQQPDQEPLDEIDGLDEVFLPADCGPWQGKPAIANAIIDDELAQWTGAITAKGAFLFVVVDACCSGTVLRGQDGEEVREVPAEELVSLAALQRAKQAALARGPVNQETSDSTFHLGISLPRLVALYAAQPNEPTVERLPPDGSSTKKYGLLTYTMCQVLTQAQAPLTYRELVQRIYGHYVQWRRSGPTPLLEGGTLDREVLGRRDWPGRSRWLLQKNRDGGWKINAGSLHAVTAGSILAVYPPAGQAQTARPIGHVRVEKVGILDAEVRPWAHGGQPAPAALPPEARCELVVHDYGEQRLRLAIIGKELQPFAQQVRQDLAKSSAVFCLVDQPAQADWMAQAEGGQLYLTPTGTGLLADAKLPPRFLLAREDPVAALRQTLERIARAQNLVALTAAIQKDVARGSSLNLEVVMVQLKDKADTKGQPMRWQERGKKLRAGDFVAWRLHNHSSMPLDVSLLFVDSQFGIHAVFPRPGLVSDNRLPPGQSYQTPALRVNARTTGLEHMVVLALPGKGPPLDFTWLAQPTLELAEQHAPRGRSTLATPLGRLLQHGLYAHGTTRGLVLEALEEHWLALQSWRVEPAIP